MIEALIAALDATWPPAETVRCGGFTVGRGVGGGRRVSAAHATDTWEQADIEAAVAQQAEWGQAPLFRVRYDDAVLIAALEMRGYRPHDDTIFMVAPVLALTDLPLPRVTAFAIWPPLAIQRDIWAEAGIGAERVAVMERAQVPKAALLGRIHDRAAGAGYAAIHDDIVMVHALEVVPAQRRQGLAGWMMRAAAFWGAENGAARIALAVTRENAAANALYDGLGLRPAGGYRYYS